VSSIFEERLDGVRTEWTMFFIETNLCAPTSKEERSQRRQEWLIDKCVSARAYDTVQRHSQAQIVDVVNECAPLHFAYPGVLKQRRIAAGLKGVSEAGFGNCAGFIDGMFCGLKTNTKECQDSDCINSNFFCGRKHKYGFTCRALVTSMEQALDICLKHPASTSDYLSHDLQVVLMILSRSTSLQHGLSIMATMRMSLRIHDDAIQECHMDQ
jgi:hypothetical protein